MQCFPFTSWLFSPNGLRVTTHLVATTREVDDDILVWRHGLSQLEGVPHSVRSLKGWDDTLVLAEGLEGNLAT